MSSPEAETAPDAELLADAIAPPHAWGGPAVRGRLRASPEDFVVEELPKLAPDGDGDHAWLEVRKRGANTEWVARALARHAGVRPVEVGFAGLKDRDARTTQWFSVNLQGRTEPDWQALDEAGVEVLNTTRGRRKLRRGQLAGNRFVLRVRELSGDFGVLRAGLGRLEEGVPNYFGPQRFGHGGGNLPEAASMFRRRQRMADRHRRGIYLSAARSALFNRVLARRVREDCWRRALAGDRLLAGDGTSLPFDGRDAGMLAAVASARLHPSGPLWGRGRPLVEEQALALETAALADLAEWRNALEHAGLEQERRALRLVPVAPRWQLDEAGGVLEIAFELPPGTYATVVLREFVCSA